MFSFDLKELWIEEIPIPQRSSENLLISAFKVAFFHVHI